MDAVRIRLDTAQFVRGLPTWLGFAEKAEEKPPPEEPGPRFRYYEHDPELEARRETMTRLNEEIWKAWLEFKAMKEEERKGEGA